MRRVSILCEVDDMVFDNVVEPLKRQKKFSEVIKILLSGYMNDAYIAQYVEGTQDAYKQKNEEDLLDALDSMKETLAQISFANEEASSYVNEGASVFSGENKQKTEESRHSNKEGNELLLEDKVTAEERLKEAEERHKKELDDFKQESDRLLEEVKKEMQVASEKQMKDFQKTVSDMIKMAFKKGVINTRKEEEVEEETPVVKENVVNEISDSEETPEVEEFTTVDDFAKMIQEEVTQPHESGYAEEKTQSAVETPKNTQELELADDDPLNEEIFELPEDDDDIDIFGEEEYGEEESLDFLNNLLEGQVKSF